MCKGVRERGERGERERERERERESGHYYAHILDIHKT